MKFRLLDLFSGIGGFSLGLERSGYFETVAFCEIEEFPRRVLKKHWPEVPCYDDVRTLSGTRLVRDGIAVDAICGGFPCQDISTAGKGAGIRGSRSGLWTEYARIIGEIRPRFVIVENVGALLSRGMGVVLGDLSALGYDAIWECIPHGAIDPTHERDRIWIVAYPNQDSYPDIRTPASNLPYAKAEPPGSRRSHELGSGFSVQRDNSYAGIRRAIHGIPYWVDRCNALGNAVVPQIPEIIGRAIGEWASQQ